MIIIVMIVILITVIIVIVAVTTVITTVMRGASECPSGRARGGSPHGLSSKGECGWPSNMSVLIYIYIYK